MHQILTSRLALVAEFNASGTVLARHAHGPAAGVDDPLVSYNGASASINNARFLQNDARGSIVYSSDRYDSAASRVINTYDEYGQSGAGNEGRFQYTGQVWLPELGMYYYKARIYSPALGRFMQTDPIGYEDNVNLYGYVGQDPINGVDPTGMYKCDSEAACRFAEQAERDLRSARNRATAKTGTRINRARNMINRVIRNFGTNDGRGVNVTVVDPADMSDPGAAAEYRRLSDTIAINSDESTHGGMDAGFIVGHEVGHRIMHRGNHPWASSSEEIVRETSSFYFEYSYLLLNGKMSERFADYLRGRDLRYLNGSCHMLNQMPYCIAKRERIPARLEQARRERGF